MSTTTDHAQPELQLQQEGPDRVTVAVGEDSQLTGAVLWASTEAARLGLPLQIVAAVPVVPDPSPFRPPNPRTAELEMRDKERDLQLLADQLTGQVEVLPLVIETGPTARAVLEHTDDHTRYLVLGHRALHAAQRLLSGSVSILLAGRSPVPVVVVPDGWELASHASEPVVVGVELRHTDAGPDTDRAVLDTAFALADDLKVSLVAVHAWEVPPLLSWSPTDIQGRRQKIQAAFEVFLQPWQQRFPEVGVTTHAVAERPADAILGASTAAQLVVVGRHTPAASHGGFHIGSTARKVMHHQQTPVLVLPGPVPVPADDMRPYDTWAPMF